MTVTYETWRNDLEPDVPLDNDTKGAFEVLGWAFEQYNKKIVYACSFGAEGVVLIDLISKVNPNAEVVFLDTGLHFNETYDLIKKVDQQYPALNVRIQKPEMTVGEQAIRYGEALWERQPNRCCHYRKIVPLEKALKGVDAWISGLRRNQSPSRSNTNFVNKDDKFLSVKICPLIHWTWEDIWNYIRENDLPYNVLHDQGYPSIGCEMCTMPAGDATDLRSGRWAQLEKTECGLHQS
jgi:phosphoadenosine phosphosulfate reductase